MKTQDLLLSDFKKILPPRGVLIGVDYGNVRIGLAVSDAGRSLALPLKTIAKLRELDDIVAAREPAGFVIGMPFTLAGEEGAMAAQVRLFAARVAEKYGLPVFFQDERLTSFGAEELLKEAGLNGKKRKKKLDAQAACLILQAALDSLKAHSSNM